MNLQELKPDIQALKEDMLFFESKYGIDSETVYLAYINGNEPKDDRWTLDFGEWASIYRTWLSFQEECQHNTSIRPT